MILQQPEPDDYVIATGAQRSVREFFVAAASELGIGLAWEGKGQAEVGRVARVPAGRFPALKNGQPVVRIDPRYFRPTEVETLLGDASKAKAKLGWVPEIPFEKLVSEMMSADLRWAERDDLARRHGHKAYQYNE
jgi:GDPmannose 4,6-dehydratase